MGEVHRKQAVESQAPVATSESMQRPVAEAIELTALHSGSADVADFRQNIRKQIMATASASKGIPVEKINSSVNQAVAMMVSSATCDVAVLEQGLAQLYQGFSQIYNHTEMPQALRTRRFICPTGLVISPDHCTETIKDTRRLHAFVYGIDQALKSLHKVGKKIHIVYPACGPFAPLLVPLLCYYKNNGLYSADDLEVSLIDIQEGAVASLNNVIRLLNLDDIVTSIHCCNALDYQADKPVHLVVLEALQHGFSREGHLSLAKHFADILEADGLFLPENISVGAALARGQREYVDQWLDSKGEEETKQSLAKNIRSERIELGNILDVNMAMLRNMKTEVQDEHTQLLKCGAVTIPEASKLPADPLLILHTKVKVFADAHIDEYESGITHPLPDLQVCVNFTPMDKRADDLLVNSGDTLRFYYCMNGLPGFLPIKEELSSEALDDIDDQPSDMGMDFSSSEIANV